jgi:hypothetical protein
MTRIINWILGKSEEKSSNNNHNMSDVMRRVDQQIGHAVTRLSDR